MEQNLLGSIIVDGRGIEMLAGSLEPSDLILPHHRVLYAAMLRLHDGGTVPDIGLLAHELNGDLESAGGVAYLAALGQQVPTSIHLPYYAKTVLDDALMRRQQDIGRAMATATAEEMGRLTVQLEQMLARQRRGQVVDWQDKSESLDQLYDRLSGPASADDTGIPSGLRSIDKIMRGLRREEMTVIGARTGVGKTSLATTISYHVSVTQRRHTLFFSAEMSRDRIWEKLAAIDLNMDWRHLTGHSLSADEVCRLGDAIARVKAAPIDVVPSIGKTVTWMWDAASRVHARTPVDLIVIDYLQLVRLERHSENRVQEIGELSRTMKELADHCQCHVIALCQLNREIDKNPNREPILSDLRDGGTIEQDAHNVWFIHHPDGSLPNPPPEFCEFSLIVAKQRMGERGRTTIGFRGPQMQFVDLVPPAGPVAAVRSFLNRHDADEEPF